MKKFFLLAALSLSLMGAAQAQNANGHFTMRYSGGVAETNLETFCRTQLPKLCEGSTFEVTRDELNRQGIRTVTMQQYVNGVRVNGKTINVHVRNGKITSINGNVMTTDMVSAETMRRAPRPAAQVMQQAGLSEQLAEKAELVVFVKDGVAHQAYLVLAGFDQMHIDALTGEVLSKKSIILDADEEPEMVPGKGMTFFSGEQDIKTAYEDGQYSLLDYDRKIYTLDCSFEKILANGFMEKVMNGMDQISATINSSDLFLNDSPNWLDTTFKTYLGGLTVEIDSPEHLGKYVIGEVCLEDGTSVFTEPAALMGMMTELPLARAIDHEQQTVNSISAYFYNPETGEKNRFVEISDITPTPNAVTYALSDDFIIFANNYFEGYHPVIDIHWGMSEVMKFYKDFYNYDSFDNKGTDIYCLVNPMDQFTPSENACAIPLGDGAPGLMMFGLGGSRMYPVVELVVMGHEFTHLVARNLASPNPDSADCHAGALNESFADIMGLYIQHAVTGEEEWSIGARVMRNGVALRYFDEPELRNHPSCYLDANFDTEKYEVHRNAGVQNHMFYLLATGGEGINSLGQSYMVNPIGRFNAELLAFETLTGYTFAEMSYEDAAEAWAAVAADHFGENSYEYNSVLQAWAAVGIGNGDITSIEQLNQDNTQKRGLRYNLQGQRVGKDYTGVVVEI